jgi:S1-C subfamily serine protease
VQKAILAHKIGDTITLLIQRGRDQQTVQVKAGTIPQSAF